jgi:hypothetical protein
MPPLAALLDTPVPDEAEPPESCLCLGPADGETEPVLPTSPVPLPVPLPEPDEAIGAVVGTESAGAGSKPVAAVDFSFSDVSAPPELRTTTTGAVELDRVASPDDWAADTDVEDVDVVRVALASAVDTDEAVSPAAVLAVPVELVDSDVLAAPAVPLLESGLAHATPEVVATATGTPIPTPNATANAPTRPICAA